MDIKGLVRTIVPLAPTAQSVAAKRRAQAGSASDRDADGRSEQGEEQQRRKLSAEEIKDVIQYLEALPGVKDNNLRVRLEEGDGTRVIYIEDPGGKVIRRIPEADMGILLANKKQPQGKTSGNLLNKTA